MSLCQGGAGHGRGRRVRQSRRLGGVALRRQVRVRRLRGGPNLQRLQEAVNLAEGRSLRTGGRRLFVVLKQGLGRLCREGSQNAVRRGRRHAGAGLWEGEG